MLSLRPDYNLASLSRKSKANFLCVEDCEGSSGKRKRSGYAFSFIFLVSSAVLKKIFKPKSERQIASSFLWFT